MPGPLRIEITQEQCPLQITLGFKGIKGLVRISWPCFKSQRKSGLLASVNKKVKLFFYQGIWSTIGFGICSLIEDVIYFYVFFKSTVNYLLSLLLVLAESMRRWVWGWNQLFTPRWQSDITHESNSNICLWPTTLLSEWGHQFKLPTINHTKKIHYRVW